MLPLRRYSLTTTSGTRRRTSWTRATCAPASRWPSRQAPPARKSSAADLTVQGLAFMHSSIDWKGQEIKVQDQRRVHYSLPRLAPAGYMARTAHCACAGCACVCAQTAQAPVVEYGAHAPHHQQPAACSVQSVDAMSCSWMTLRGRMVLLVVHACAPAASLSASWLHGQQLLMSRSSGSVRHAATVPLVQGVRLTTAPPPPPGPGGPASPVPAE